MKSCTFWSQPSKFFPKKIPYNFPKESHYEKISYIFSRESCSYICGNETGHFLPQARKIKEIHSGKISYISGNGKSEKVIYISGGNLQSLKIKNFLYFSL